MHRNPYVPRKQSGVALVMSIVLLIIMTIVGVSLLSGTVLQERMSGNMRLQALAFEAASAGIAEARIHGLDRDNVWAAAGVTSCRRGTGGGDADLWSTGWSHTEVQEWFPNGENSEYRLLVYCMQDLRFLEAAGFDLGGEDAADPSRLPPQLFVVSEGRAPIGAGEGRALRQLEIRVEDPLLNPQDLDPTIRIEGDRIALRTANSDSFIVDGDGGPAIATSTEAWRDYIIDRIENTGPGRMHNYLGSGEGPDDPPIVAGAGSYPFNSPAELWTFVSDIRQSMRDSLINDNVFGSEPASGAWSGSVGTCGFNYVKQNLRGGGNVPQCDVSSPVTNLNEIDFNDGKLTFVDGDAVIGGEATGSGVVIVTGNVCFHGRADFKGQVIVLGGLYEMRGGGNGETLGSIFAADIDVSDGSPVPSGWGDTTMDFRGGGNHTIAYDCQGLLELWGGLNQCGLADQWVPFECDGDGGRAVGMGAQNRMIGWRENLGWRERQIIDANGCLIIDPALENIFGLTQGDAICGVVADAE